MPCEKVPVPVQVQCRPLCQDIWVAAYSQISQHWGIEWSIWKHIYTISRPSACTTTIAAIRLTNRASKRTLCLRPNLPVQCNSSVRWNSQSFGSPGWKRIDIKPFLTQSPYLGSCSKLWPSREPAFSFESLRKVSSTCHEQKSNYAVPKW